MNELSYVLQEVLKALGIEGAQTIGLLRAPGGGDPPGDHHPRTAVDPDRHG